MIINYKNYRAVYHWIYITLLLISLLSASCISRTTIDYETEITPTPIPTVPVAIKPTYTVQKGEVISKIQFLGRVAPVNEENLYFGVDGRIRKIYRKENEKVEPGTIIADLTSMDNLESQQAFLNLDLRRAEIRADIANQNLLLARIQNSYFRPEYPYIISLREKDLELAQIAVEEMKLKIKAQQDQISASRITAPFAGTIVSSRLSEGGKVNALEPMVVFADLSKLEVVAKLDSTQLNQVAEGMAILAVLTDRPGQELSGKIRRLPYSAATTDIKSPDQNVRIALDIKGDQSLLKLNDLVRVTVVLEKRSDALWLPPQAIRTFDGRKFVVIKDGDLQKRIDIKTGIQGDDRIEIVEGLIEGQLVIVQ